MLPRSEEAQCVCACCLRCGLSAFEAVLAFFFSPFFFVGGERKAEQREKVLKNKRRGPIKE